MRHFVFVVCFTSVATIACDKAEPADQVPSCDDVVAHSDELAVEYARSRSQERSELLKKKIARAKEKYGGDEAIEICEKAFSDRQKRCVMAAETLGEKNDCLRAGADR